MKDLSLPVSATCYNIAHFFLFYLFDAYENPSSFSFQICHKFVAYQMTLFIFLQFSPNLIAYEMTLFIFWPFLPNLVAYDMSQSEIMDAYEKNKCYDVITTPHDHAQHQTKFARKLRGKTVQTHAHRMSPGEYLDRLCGGKKVITSI